MSRIFPVFVSLCLLAGPLLADDESNFSSANQLFENGDFTGAAKAYRQLAESGKLSPELFYNLGAAQHRLGNEGEAVLWMRRALYLDPGMPEPTQSLSFLRTHLAFFEFAGNGLERFLSSINASAFLWIRSLALWIAALATVAAFSIPRLKPNRSALVTLSIVMLMLAVVAWRADRYRENRLTVDNLATVISDSASALTAPSPDAKEVVTLPPGSEIRLLQQAGAWTYAEIPGELRGWLRTETVAKLWPVHPSELESPES
ncbi:MAG: tetratricopeptide repeat protein [Verrucomicrobiae bacterium]|nr:tetratricopeptide repeat protein [Verrucomicrobiae bacterium]